MRVHFMPGCGLYMYSRAEVGAAVAPQARDPLWSHFEFASVRHILGHSHSRSRLSELPVVNSGAALLLRNRSRSVAAVAGARDHA